MRIQILDAAEQDLIDGFNFYNSREVGLGDYFLDSLFSDIDSLYLYARIHLIQFTFYRMLSNRFPYAIFYKLENDIVKVLGNT